MANTLDKSKMHKFVKPKSKKVDKKQKSNKSTHLGEQQPESLASYCSSCSSFDSSDSESEKEFDPEKLRELLQTYSKEQLVDLVCPAAQLGSSKKRKFVRSKSKKFDKKQNINKSTHLQQQQPKSSAAYSSSCSSSDSSDSESEKEFDSEDLREHLQPYSKEQLVDLVCSAAQPEKPEKSKKKSKDKKKKHKKSDESEEESETPIVILHPVTVPIAATSKQESDSDFESDKEDVKVLLESYSKEELINLTYRTAEKGSRLISAVLESADRDSSQRNIFVPGLGWDTTHENLKAAFEVYGEIEECSVVMDKDTGRAKGYGFVLFKTRKGAREALRNPEKRMYNRTVSCNLSKPSNAGKAREPVKSVKIDLTHTVNQNETALPGPDMAHGLDKGHQQPRNMAMYAGQNMPFYGHSQRPGFNLMYDAMMGNQGAMMSNQMVAGLPPNYRTFGSGMMNQGPMAMVPSNHMALAGQYVGGDYTGNSNGVGPIPGFDGW